MRDVESFLKQRNWYEEKSEMIEESKAYRDMKLWELKAIRIALTKSDMPKDILQELWRKQRYLLAIVKEENARIQHLRFS